MSNTLTENDKNLVLQLKENEVEAFDLLFHKYSEKLYSFSFSLLKNHEDSKEIIQEAFIRIWEKRHDIDTTKSFKSFLFKISYNLIIDQLRTRLKDNEYREFLVRYFETDKFDFHTNIDCEVISDKVKKAVNQLPEKRKQIYILSREAGLSHKEIAAKMGITTKTVENQIGLTLKYIRECLGKDIIAILLFISIFS